MRRLYRLANADDGRAQRAAPSFLVQRIEWEVPPLRHQLGRAPRTAITFGHAFFVAVGLLCCLAPPAPQTSAVGEPFAETAFCMRAQRRPDYVQVQLALGTPARIVPALFRPDRVVPRGAEALRVFSPRAVESTTLRCNGSSCFDTVLASQGTSASYRVVTVGMTYVNQDVEEAAYGVARYHLRLEAEVSAVEGARYWLTATHLCVDPSPAPLGDTTSALRARVDGRGDLVVTARALAGLAAQVLHGAAVRDAWHAGLCTNGTDSLGVVTLFPPTAAVEQLHLALADVALYEYEPSAVSRRRSVVELGTRCASGVASMSRPYDRWRLDCDALRRCWDEPSLPWRRVATNDMRAHYVGAGEVYFWFQRRSLLDAMPGLHEARAALAIGVAKLALISLVAATIWIRVDRETSAPTWLYRHCVETAHCVQGLASRHASVAVSVSEDAALGLLCVAARACVVVWWTAVLVEDGQSRVALVETVASALSLLHWSARHLAMKPNMFQTSGSRDRNNDPLTRLGGSSAVVDGVMGVLVMHARTPLLASEGGFDATARLLTGTMLVIVSLERALFSLCCCSVIVEARDRYVIRIGEDYRLLLLSSSVFWALQIGSIAVAVADLVATPIAASVMRAQVGDSMATVVVIFLLLVALGTTRLLSTCVDLVTPPK